jgi:hypothetical protein
MATLRSGFSLLIIVLVISLACLPAAAADETPLSPGEIGIRQAHLSWIALTRDAEMNAAITYIYPLFETNTTRLNSLYANFQNLEAQVPGTTTRAGFDNLTSGMRSVTGEFRNETAIQMSRGQGKWDVLTLNVRAATTGNPYIDEKAQAYWGTRKLNQLRDFDAWLLNAQGALDQLNRQGYDIAAPQRTHDVIASKRPDLTAALDSKSNDQIAAVNTVILGLSQQLGSQVAEAQAGVSGSEKTRFYIDQGYRAVYVADTLNENLTQILLDIGPAEPALKKVKVDLAATEKALNAGNLARAKTPLLLVKSDLRDLAATYRDIVNTADLPPDLSATLRALILNLDNTSDQMDVNT